jgi:transposase-like protein
MVTYNDYTDSFRREIVREVKSGHLSKEQASRKYSIKGHSTVTNWIRKFEGRDLTNHRMPKLEKSTKKDLIKRLKELERQLEDEKIRSEGLSKMIDIAEDQLNIEIRKKSGTKQSKR